jgi:hypothetical protein
MEKSYRETDDYHEYESLFKKDFPLNLLVTVPMRRAIGEIASYYQVSMADIVRICIARAAPEIYPRWPEVYAKYLKQGMREVLQIEGDDE